ncbi:MAG: sigma-70 family RNA polymerase sigma factor [Deltaproteobacteria bacterium]|nr:sigma-70 family RNA polymerase sigma factor [Deltaproteobacteria bacterium]
MDADIERRIRSHDHRGALRALADAYGAPLGRFCQALLGSREDGADALQDTLVAALQAMPRYRGEHGVRAWVFGIARHQCATIIRKRSRRRSVWSRLFGGGDLAAAPASPAESADARLSLERALLGLPEAQREAVLLRYQLGMDATEVADVLGITHAAARKRISIGMQALRSTMDALPHPRPAPSNPSTHPSDLTRDPGPDEAPHDDHTLRTTEDPARVRS